MYFETRWHELMKIKCLTFLAGHTVLAGWAWAGLCTHSQQTCQYSCRCQPRCDSRVSVQSHCLHSFGDIQGKKKLMGTEASNGNEIAEMVKYERFCHAWMLVTHGVTCARQNKNGFSGANWQGLKALAIRKFLAHFGASTFCLWPLWEGTLNSYNVAFTGKTFRW